MNEVVLASALRTPLGDFGGTLKAIPASDLAQLVMEEVVKRIGGSSAIEKVIFGNCFSPLEQNVARVSAYRAGIPEHVPGFTINGTCGSSMQAVISAVQAVQCGEAQVVLAGGVESMSNAPYIMEICAVGTAYKACSGLRPPLERDAGISYRRGDGSHRGESCGKVPYFPRRTGRLCRPEPSDGPQEPFSTENLRRRSSLCLCRNPRKTPCCLTPMSTSDRM